MMNLNRLTVILQLQIRCAGRLPLRCEKVPAWHISRGAGKAEGLEKDMWETRDAGAGFSAKLTGLFIARQRAVVNISANINY